MNFRSRIDRIESESTVAPNSSLKPEIANLEEAQTHVAHAIVLLRTVSPLNDYDRVSLTEATLELQGLFSQIEYLLAERGIPSSICDWHDGIYKPSHLTALVSVFEDDPDGDCEGDPPIDPKKFKALPFRNQEIVREAIKILQERDGGELSEDKKGVLEGRI